MKDEEEIFDYAVVGGGAHGLSAAYYLSKKAGKVALFEQFNIGHNNGSSHGSTRISRSVYENKVYTELNRLCLNENWKEMEKVLGEQLLHPSPFIYFDSV